MKKRIPVITFMLIGLNILGFLYEFIVGQNLAVLKYGMFQGALTAGYYDRMIGSAFLHFGFYHFACNMLCLVSYGFSLETRIGPLKYLVIYFVAIIGAGILIDQAGGNGIHAGASGAIWGLMTATLVYNIRNKIDLSYALRGIIMNLIYSFSAGISWQAHIGGGIAGLLVALIICQRVQTYQVSPSDMGDSQASDYVNLGGESIIKAMDGGDTEGPRESTELDSFALKFSDLTTKKKTSEDNNKEAPISSKSELGSLKYGDLNLGLSMGGKAKGWTCRYCGAYNDEGVVCRKCALYK